MKPFDISEHKFHYTYWLQDSDGMAYIGSRTCSCDPIDDNYYSSSSWVHDAIRRGIEFNKIILSTWPTRKDALDHEILLHEIFDVAKSEKFYNKSRQLSNGFAHDNTGIKASESTRIKLSLSKSGDKHPNFGKRGPGTTAYGHRHTEEQKKTMTLIGEENGMYGKKHKPESIDKMKLNRPDIHGDSNPFYGKKHKSESLRFGEKNHMYGIKRESHPNSKSCITPKGTYNSVKDAADAYSVCDETIRNWVRVKKEGFKIERKQK